MIKGYQKTHYAGREYHHEWHDRAHFIDEMRRTEPGAHYIVYDRNTFLQEYYDEADALECNKNAPLVVDLLNGEVSKIVETRIHETAAIERYLPGMIDEFEFWVDVYKYDMQTATVKEVE